MNEEQLQELRALFDKFPTPGTGIVYRLHMADGSGEVEASGTFCRMLELARAMMHAYVRKDDERVRFQNLLYKEQAEHGVTRREAATAAEARDHYLREMRGSQEIAAERKGRADALEQILQLVIGGAR